MQRKKNASKTLVKTSNVFKLKKLTSQAFLLTSDINKNVKTIENGTVIVYYPNNYDFRRFLSKLPKNDVENDVN